jgi:hypothetical protein
MSWLGTPLIFSEFATGFFGAFPRFAIRFPRCALWLTILIIIASIPGLNRLKLRTDAQTLAPVGDAKVEFDRAIRQKFGIEDQMVVIIRAPGPEGIFNPVTIKLVRDLTAAFARLRYQSFSSPQPGYRAEFPSSPGNLDKPKTPRAAARHKA